MTWFTASIVTYLKEDTPQTVFPVFEDFILFESDARAGAMDKARAYAIELVASDDSTFFESRPVKRVFAGVRKLRSIYNESASDIDSEPPSDGSELSHSYFELNSEDEIQRLAAGEALTVFYRDDQ